MPPNIFGNVGGDALTNPLTENLDVGGFELQDVDKIFTNEIHDNGQGNITVHEQLHLQNNRLTHMGDPVAGTDGVNLDYLESNFASQASVPTSAPYDLYGAFTDEDTPITIGIQPLTLNVPRGFSCSGVRAFLKNGATTAPYYVVDVRKNGVVIPQGTGLCEWSIAGETTSSLGTFTAGNVFLALGDKITVTMNTDATASGLKIVFYGSVSI